MYAILPNGSDEIIDDTTLDTTIADVEGSRIVHVHPDTSVVVGSSSNVPPKSAYEDDVHLGVEPPTASPILSPPPLPSSLKRKSPFVWGAGEIECFETASRAYLDTKNAGLHTGSRNMFIATHMNLPGVDNKVVKARVNNTRIKKAKLT
mmetsp:Transcript_15723/g.26082  ORF Transcript_15723/g.26082 Transcript_15723/m.26082 type:complete len:149 (+) Transcript_15723:506-952(+)|eukprot:CAMPEP_0184673018 /NCGR_PEP_ID=MMETSP0308-20130426/86427_1 /TAXON_ID=38269 /ORGANISM="Gloeochaete witrockiana, Strain SAG 46.84" /LENGTH=148 /DNA_ID=CAMNT_0027120449 /DNA_START=1181 /DNA_END=1627 /DNA_ORIENTATION=+